ncbi:unnamed protein product [Boreogadus saida]
MWPDGFNGTNSKRSRYETKTVILNKGRLEGIEVQRLKDKLGTRQMPTAELLLDGLPAHRVLKTMKSGSGSARAETDALVPADKGMQVRVRVNMEWFTGKVVAVGGEQEERPLEGQVRLRPEIHGPKNRWLLSGELFCLLTLSVPKFFSQSDF